MKKKSVLILAVFMAFPAVAFAGDDEWLEPVGAEKEVYVAATGDFYKTKIVGGKVDYSVCELCFDVGGVVDKLNLSLGDYVEKYSTIASISQAEEQKILDDYIAEIDKKQQELLLSEKAFAAETDDMIAKREEYLAMIAAGTASNYEKMQAELLELYLEKRDTAYEDMLEQHDKIIASMEEKINELNQGLTYNYMVSPCDGQVIYCSLKEGNYVNAYEYVVAIMDSNEMYISAPELGINNEREAGIYDAFYAVAGGERIELEYVSYPGEGFSGKTYFKPKNGDISEYKNVIIEAVSDLQKDVLMIPKECVYRDGDEMYVYKMENGIREKAGVICGDDNGGMVVITGGSIKEGDVIYVP